LVAIVLLVAYGNFQDRLALALGLTSNPTDHCRRSKFVLRGSRCRAYLSFRTAAAREQPDEQTASNVADATGFRDFSDLQTSSNLSAAGAADCRAKLERGP